MKEANAFLVILEYNFILVCIVMIDDKVICQYKRVIYETMLTWRAAEV